MKSSRKISRIETELPAFVAPQLATLVSDIREGAQWLHELKFDGYRILCRIDDGQVSLLTRNAQDWTGRFDPVVRAARTLPIRQAIIDGEVVAMESNGTHSFQLLQNSLRGGAATCLIYYAFDLLYLDGRDLRRTALVERKGLLENRLSGGGKTTDTAVIRYSEHWTGEGQELFAKACGMGMEGILSKRIDDPYRSGRGRSWLKIKCSKSQEFVIGGFTNPAGARVGFGALLLGYYDDTSTLRYAGRVGTGFDDRSLRDLSTRLKKLARKSTPFASASKSADFRGVHWVDPLLACEITFSGWTSDGLLRHPAFKGLREDKPARDIVREVTTPLTEALSGGKRR